MVVDPQGQARRGNILRIVGILATVIGAGLLIGGITLMLTNILSADAFDFFWMPFVGAMLLAGGIMAWVAGNLSRGSARFAGQSAGSAGPYPLVAPPSVGAVSGWNCRQCGNHNQQSAAECSVCGTARS